MVQKVKSNDNSEVARSHNELNLTRSMTADDFSVILRHKSKHASQTRNKQRRDRVVSCPDEFYLSQISSSADIKMIDLRKICEDGEQFLESRKSTSTIKQSDDEIFSLDEDDNHSKSFDNFNNLEERNIDPCTVERLASLFEADIKQIVERVLLLPDSDFKYDMIHVSCSRLFIVIYAQTFP